MLLPQKPIRLRTHKAEQQLHYRGVWNNLQMNFDTKISLVIWLQTSTFLIRGVKDKRYDQIFQGIYNKKSTVSVLYLECVNGKRASRNLLAKPIRTAC